MTKTIITIKKLKIDLAKIVSKKISRAWKGYGSALFLELGSLHDELSWEKSGKPTTSPTGEWTLSGEGTWKLIRKSNVILDTKTASNSEMKELVKSFEGLKIKSTEINAELTSLILHLSNKDTLEFNKADYGFFTLLSNEKPYISVENKNAFIHHLVL